MTHLHTVIAVGRYRPRWFYPERIEGATYVGRVWSIKTRLWSAYRTRVSLLAVNRSLRDEDKPRPPSERLVGG